MQFKIALRNVMRNPRRSLAQTSTIAVCVFGLLFIQSFFSGLMSMHAENSVHSRHGHGQVTSKGYWDQSFENPMEHWISDPTAVIKTLTAHPDVESVFPRVQFYGLLSNGTVNVAGRGQGIVGEREAGFFDRMNFIEGGPIRAREDGIVMGRGLAKALSAHVGDRLTVLSQTVRGTLSAVEVELTGIFHVGFKEADDSLFQIQLDQAQVLLDTTRIESVAIGLRSDEAWPRVAATIEHKHPDMEAMSVYEVDAVWAKNGQLFLTALMNIFRLTFLGMILLAIYSSASNTVLERKREYGILRANGESCADLARLLVLEGLLMALVGSLVGIVAVYGVDLFSSGGIPMPPTPGTNRELAIELDIQGLYPLTAMAMGALAVVSATVVSTLQIGRLSIVQAIRSPV